MPLSKIYSIITIVHTFVDIHIDVFPENALWKGLRFNADIVIFFKYSHLFDSHMLFFAVQVENKTKIDSFYNTVHQYPADGICSE